MGGKITLKTFWWYAVFVEKDYNIKIYEVISIQKDDKLFLLVYYLLRILQNNSKWNMQMLNYDLKHKSKNFMKNK